MTPERYQQIRQLFEAALDRAPEARAAFLEQACGIDADLRTQVEQLLINHVADEESLAHRSPAVAADPPAQNARASLPRQDISHYRLLALLGVGGMGEVYLAEDRRLRRKIALKVLPDSIARDKDRLRRFEQEAIAASALNHPNILTIYEFGAEGAAHFLAAELIDGETLRARLQRAPLPLDQALDIAAQTAQALAAAHEAGIIHRDIKPENVMLRRDGIVKVLDFGLAKLLEPALLDTGAITREMASTRVGALVGTVAYMSPEQARGRSVDARTDLFSLGVMLYEMLTRRLPFTGETISHTIVAILEKEPPSLSQFASDAPAELAFVVARALRKERGERYQSARELLGDLRRIEKRLVFEAERERSAAVDIRAQGEAPPALIAPPPPSSMTSPVRAIWSAHKRGLAALSILLAATGLAYWFVGSRAANAEEIGGVAVLPFVNVSGQTDVEYLSDGISESLINNLSQLPKLKVIARSSAFKFKGKELDPQTVARVLDVEVVVMGRVEQRGDSLVVSAELVDADSMTQLWGEQYNRKASDLVAVQAELSREIALRLRPRLSRDEQQRVARNYTTENESYRLYLKGRYFWNKRTQEGYAQAIEAFQQATERDPNYALPFVGLADAQAFLRVRGQSGDVAYRVAKATVQRALELDDALGEAHVTLAMLRQNADWDWAGAEQEYQRALSLSPNYATAHHWYGELLIQMGRVAEGLTLQTRALELDPLSLAISSDLGLFYYYARQYDRALEQLQKTVALDPHFFRTYLYLARVHEQQGEYDKAITNYQQGLLRSGEAPDRTTRIAAALSAALMRAGERGYWQKRLEIQHENPSLHVEWECDRVGIHARLGERDQAFMELERVYRARLFDVLFLKVAPEFDGLRADPRFQDLMRRIGLPE